MPDFIAVTNGSGASGYLIANGNVYPAASGGPGGMHVPGGHYTYGGPQALTKKQYHGMSDGKHPGKFRKFHIGTGPQGSGDIWDPTLKRYRQGIEFHFDGGNPGTAGCIGFQDPTAKDALIADTDKHVDVSYMSNMDQVRAEVEKKLGHKVDWSKVPAPKAPGASSGTHSKTKKGKKVKKGHPHVLVGKKRRQVAHRTAPLQGGGKIVDGSPSVFVGRERFRVSRIDDLTTDGSVLASGEATIDVG
jgi:hypothetical protein